MNPELKLRFLKAIINLPIRVLDRFIHFPTSPAHAQTQIILNIYRRLKSVYHLEKKQGVFGCAPDGNFERFLRVSLKIIAGISEDDRYYRAWLGLAILLARDEVILLTDDLPALKRAVKTQCLMNLDFLPEAQKTEFKSDLLIMGLSENLGNLIGGNEK